MLSLRLTPVLFVMLFGISSSALAREGEAGRPRLVAQLGHSEPLEAVALDPDGKWAATAGQDATVVVWEVATGREIRRLAFESNIVWDLAISPDGHRLFAGGTAGRIQAWAFPSGKPLFSRVISDDRVDCLDVSADGARLAASGGDGIVRFLDPGTGRDRASWSAGRPVKSLAFSPDGRSALTGGTDGKAVLHDAKTGAVTRSLDARTPEVFGVAFSPDGSRIAVTSRFTALIFETATGRPVRELTGHRGALWSVAWSPDGRSVLTGSSDGTARIWNPDDGSLRRELRGHGGGTPWVKDAVFSPRRTLVATASWDRTARLWNRDSGRMLARLGPRAGQVGTLAVSPDGRALATGNSYGHVLIWDLTLGRIVGRATSFRGAISVLVFQPEGHALLAADTRGDVVLLDARDGRVRTTMKAGGSVQSAAISPDGRTAVTGGVDTVLRFWELESGKLLGKAYGHEGTVLGAVFSPDGEALYTASTDCTVRRWDVASRKATDVLLGTEKPDVPGPPFGYLAVDISPDGQRLLAATMPGEVTILRIADGERVASFSSGASRTHGAAFFPDGKRVAVRGDGVTVHDLTGKRIGKRIGSSWLSSQTAAFLDEGRTIVTGGADRTIRLSDVATGKERARLVAFGDGTFAVSDPDGRYDASRGGEVEGLHWVVGSETISLDQLKERFYDPGLLGKILGHLEEPLRKVASLSAPRLHPAVEVDPPGEDGKLRIRLRNRGGGLGRVVVRVNGKEMTADARGPGVRPTARSAALTVDLGGDARVVRGGRNDIEIVAFNAEGYLRSRGVRIDWDAPGSSPTGPASLRAVVVGVSDYLGEEIDLRFAAKDARDFARALRTAGTRLFGADRVHLTLLTTEEGERPSRDAILAALDGLAGAGAGDVVVLYLAGHGVSRSGPEGEFCFLAADARSADLSDPGVRAIVAISSAEIAERMRDTAARKQVLVLDTCAAGRIVETLSVVREVPGSQVRALERLKDRTGLFVLAGCAADRVSYEASRYGQGLLTHSLLLGMKGAALREESYVDVLRLFGFASDRVPLLARDIGGIQRPVLAVPRGGASFDIGRLTAEDRDAVPLAQVRPVLIRSSFQHAERFSDTLRLSSRVDGALAALSRRDADAPLVHVDARDFPGAYHVAGQYSGTDGQIVVRFRLFRGDEEQGDVVVVDGKSDDLIDLADRIVREIVQRCASVKSR